MSAIQIAKETHQQQKQEERKLTQEQMLINHHSDPFAAVNRSSNAINTNKGRGRGRPVAMYASLLHHSEDHQSEHLMDDTLPPKLVHNKSQFVEGYN